MTRLVGWLPLCVGLQYLSESWALVGCIMSNYWQYNYEFLDISRSSKCTREFKTLSHWHHDLLLVNICLGPIEVVLLKNFLQLDDHILLKRVFFSSSKSISQLVKRVRNGWGWATSCHWASIESCVSRRWIQQKVFKLLIRSTD